MSKEKLIPTNEFCANHGIEISFIRTLYETGLIEITTIEDKGFIPESQLRQLEKMIRLHRELNINLEGIDSITHLLNRINNLQNEVMVLKNRLRFYEDDDFE